MFVYVGTYTEPPAGTAEGIYVYRFDPESGGLELVQAVAGIANPSYLALGPGENVLYAVGEADEGVVAAFARDARTGELTALNRQPSHGASACYVGVDATGRCALVANYDGGTVAVLPIAADGRLGPASDVVRHEGTGVEPTRQEGPHPHMAAPAPDGRYVLVPDLGTDRVLVYRLDAAGGRLVPNPDGPPFAATAPSAGPRHVAFAPDGRRVYLTNELASTLTVFDYDGGRGELRPRHTVSTLPAGFDGENTAAHVAVAPDGRFVYASNRGHDSIAVWAVDAASGGVRPIGHAPTRGAVPRHFALDPTGAWVLVANQESGTVVAFRRDRASGLLAAAGEVDVPSPVAVLFAGAAAG